MLDFSRPINCTTALEVELLAALNETRRQLTRLKSPEPPVPPVPAVPAVPAGPHKKPPAPPMTVAKQLKRSLPPIAPIVEPLEPAIEPAPDRQSRLDRLPAGQAKIIDIQIAVCQKFGFTLIELRSQRRTYKLAEARHVAVMLCHALTIHSYPFIGRFFGGRDHSTMLNSVDKLSDVRDHLISELTTQDSITTWVKHAYEQVRANRAKEELPDTDPAELVVDIKALREA